MLLYKSVYNNTVLLYIYFVYYNSILLYNSVVYYDIVLLYNSVYSKEITLQHKFKVACCCLKINYKTFLMTEWLYITYFIS